MASALRPGGVLFTSECYADYDWAVALPATLVAAGLTEVESCGDVDLVRGATPPAELLRLTVEALRERIPGDIDVDGGLAVLADPAMFEPSIVWYTAWGRRE